MVFPDLLLPNLSSVFWAQAENLSVPNPGGFSSQTHGNTAPGDSFHLAHKKSYSQWFSGIHTVEALLQLTISDGDPATQGVVLAAPSPFIGDRRLLEKLHLGIFNPQLPFNPFQLPSAIASKPHSLKNHHLQEFPLLTQDPLAQEDFALVFTPKFALAMVRGTTPHGVPQFHFSFDPQAINHCWQVLERRLLLSNFRELETLQRQLKRFEPPTPDYRLVMEFSRLFMDNLTPPDPVPSPPVAPKVTIDLDKKENTLQQLYTTEIQLLKALAHEIRTPLTTIRTLTKLLLKKRRQLGEEVTHRLESIEQECNEQINRMELIFRAIELETQTQNPASGLQLIPISLEQLLRQSIPRWQKQASRRNVILDVMLPKSMPHVVSDPSMLEQALGGLMESFTRSLPTGGEIKVQVTTAGNQLKLQLLSKNQDHHHWFESLGQLLMLQPETGSISLNWDVTKNIFAALGCKFTVRQRPQEGDVFTIFLPLGNFQGLNP